ncbi:MAG: glycosyltransferase family 39 protein [Planctomycetota bacterium]
MILFAALFVLNVGVIALKAGDGPPDPGDASDYDAIAWSLARGLGYGIDRSDPDWQRPYLEADDADDVAAFQGQIDAAPAGYHPTAYRPPLVPLLTAGVYRVAGRHFWLVRGINGVLVALALTMAVALAQKLGGPAAAVVAAVIALCDPIPKEKAAQLLTEPLILLLVAALATVLVRFTLGPRRRWKYVALAGGLMGLMILTRSLFVLWLPPLAVGVAWLAWRGGGYTRAALVQAGLMAATFALIAVTLCLPWWVRNVVLLEAPMPLGTQGGIGIPGGYSDRAMEMGGVWEDVADWGFFGPLEAEWAREGYTPSPIEAERERAIYGLDQTRAWIVEHPAAVVRLAGMKFRALWTERQSHLASVLVLVALAGAGLGRFWRGRWAGGEWALWGLVVTNVLVVTATYATGAGRFIVPVLPVLYVLAAVGGVRIHEWRAGRGRGITAGPT